MKLLFILPGKYFDKSFQEINTKNYCKGIFGFFLLSLKHFFDVKTISYETLINEKINLKDYEYIVFDTKIMNFYESKTIIDILNSSKSSISAFMHYDNLSLSINTILALEKYLNVKNYFNVSQLKDYSKFNLERKISSKIHMSHLAFGSTKVKYNFLEKKFILPNESNFKKKYNLSFIGSVSKNRKLRYSIVENIKQLNLPDCYFNLSTKNEAKLSEKEYFETVKKTKINLVLAGNFENLPQLFYENCFFKNFFLIDNHFQYFLVSHYFKNISKFMFRSIEEFKKHYEFYQSKEQRDILINEINNVFKEFYNPFKHGVFLKNKIIN